MEKLRRSQKNSKRRRQQQPASAEAAVAEPMFTDTTGARFQLAESLVVDETIWEQLRADLDELFVDQGVQASAELETVGVGDAAALVEDQATDTAVDDKEEFLQEHGHRYDDLLDTRVEQSGRSATRVALGLAAQYWVPAAKKRRLVAMVRDSAVVQRHLRRTLAEQGWAVTEIDADTPLYETQSAQYRACGRNHQLSSG